MNFGYGPPIAIVHSIIYFQILFNPNLSCSANVLKKYEKNCQNSLQNSKKIDGTGITKYKMDIFKRFYGNFLTLCR